MRRLFAFLLICAVLLAALPVLAGITATSGSHSLVITQIYNGGGSATTSPYALSYIEIFNSSAQVIDLQNWTLQYLSGTSTGAFGSSARFAIGSSDPFNQGTSGGDDGQNLGHFCTMGDQTPGCQIAYSAAFTASNCDAVKKAGQYTRHCWLNPGQYMLIQTKSASTTGSLLQTFPLTADLDLSTHVDVANQLNLSPSASAGKIALVNSHAGLPACTFTGSYGLPPTNASFWGMWADFLGYGYSASNCWEGTSATAPSFTVTATDYSNGYADMISSTIKNQSALVRTTGFTGPHNMSAPVNMAPTPCADTDNNAANFAPVRIGNSLTDPTSPATAGHDGFPLWVVHNSSQSYDVTNYVQTYTATPCSNVANTAAPTVEVQASPSVVQANTSTPVTLTVTVTNGGSNPTSAIFGITADLSPVGGLVETAEGTTPQKFGYLGLDPDGHGYIQYVFPPAPPAAPITLTINPPLADLGKTYSIPITVVDDAYRTVQSTISLKVVGSTPGNASLSATPLSVPATTPTNVALTAAITDPGSYPAGSSFTVAMDLTAIGGASAVNCPLVSTDVYTCQTSVTADVSKVGGSYTIPVTVTDDQSRSLTLTPVNIQIPVTAQPEPAATLAWVAPSTGNFGSVTQGSTSPSIQTAALTNTGLVALSVASVSTDNGDFVASTCPASLNPNATCTITVSFTPSTATARSGNLIVTDNSRNVANSQQSLALSGTGTPPPATADLSTLSLTFGNQLATTTSAAQTVTLKNNGGMALAINGIKISGVNASEFLYTTTCSATLAAGGSCTFTVTFQPASSGSKTAALAFTDGAGSSHTVVLTGAGSDFPVSAASGGSTTQSITAGSTATYNLQLTPQGGFTGQITLVCTGAPQAATCSISPASPLNVTGSAPIPVTVTVTTTARPMQTASLLAPVFAGSKGGGSSSGPKMPLLASFVVIVFGGLLTSSRRARQQWRATALCTALLCVMGLTACSGLKQQSWPTQPTTGTPSNVAAGYPGGYPVTVSATSGGVTHTTVLTLKVN